MITMAAIRMTEKHKSPTAPNTVGTITSAMLVGKIAGKLVDGDWVDLSERKVVLVPTFATVSLFGKAVDENNSVIYSVKLHIKFEFALL